MKVKEAGLGVSHPNIALIKYWGKKDVKNNIPTNASLSITTEKLTTVTKVFPHFTDEFYLNGQRIKMSERHMSVISTFKKVSGYDGGLKVVSENNFPHSCGLASSASGFSALTLALNDFFGLDLSKDEMSKLSRMGSGSSARSIFEGIVLYEGDCAKRIGEWPDLRIFVIIVKESAKKVGSTTGMIRTVNTSTLFKERLRNVDFKIKQALDFIEKRDFRELALLIMRESNELHATCLDAWPPIRYLNDESFRIIDLCLEYNNKEVKVAYTFDAGPNAFIITLDKSLKNAIDFFNENLSHEIIIAH